MKKITTLILAVPLLFSCEKENVGELDSSILSSSNTSKLDDGRLIFSSREDLKSAITDFQKNESETVSSKFNQLYNSGFRSLKPIVDPNNKNLINKLSQEIKSKSQTIKAIAQEQEIISDPYLAALVNEDKEIVVNDTLYKFTLDKGLFYAHVKDSAHLQNYVENLIASGKNMQLEPCHTRLESGGITPIDETITRYIEPIESCGGGGGGGGGGYVPPVPSLSEEERFQNVISNLTECNGTAGGNWVQNLFGDSFVCRSYFDGDHRIKTEFWNQGFGFYESVGAQVKTQTKTLGIWWASDSDEIHLGINRVALRYNYPQPQVLKYISGVPSTNTFRAPVYMYGGKFQVQSGMMNGIEYYYSDVALDVTKNALPFFRLDDEPILNIYIPNLPIIDEYEFNFSSGDITSESNIKAAYKMGIDFIKSQVPSGKKEFAVTYQKNSNEIETIYFGERFSNTNDHHIERKFYEDAGFKIGGVWGSGDGWSFSIEPVTEFYRDYTSYDLDFYGVARRGSNWKGNRMVKSN